MYTPSWSDSQTQSYQVSNNQSIFTLNLKIATASEGPQGGLSKKSKQHLFLELPVSPSDRAIESGIHNSNII